MKRFVSVPYLRDSESCLTSAGLLGKCSALAWREAVRSMLPLLARRLEVGPQIQAPHLFIGMAPFHGQQISTRAVIHGREFSSIFIASSTIGFAQVGIFVA